MGFVDEDGDHIEFVLVKPAEGSCRVVEKVNSKTEIDPVVWLSYDSDSGKLQDSGGSIPVPSDQTIMERLVRLVGRASPPVQWRTGVPSVIEPDGPLGIPSKSLLSTLEASILLILQHMCTVS